MEDIIEILYNNVSMNIGLYKGELLIEKQLLDLFKNGNGKLNAKQFTQQTLLSFLMRFIRIADELNKYRLVNDIVKIKYRDFSFELDIYEGNIMLDPSIKSLFMNGRGRMNGKNFKNQPIIDFINRLIMVYYVKTKKENG